jgi:hypothetical protein
MQREPHTGREHSKLCGYTLSFEPWMENWRMNLKWVNLKNEITLKVTLALAIIASLAI